MNDRALVFGVRPLLCGVRPVARTAGSERARLQACPHRAQSAVNHLRAIEQAAERRLRSSSDQASALFSGEPLMGAPVDGQTEAEGGLDPTVTS